MRSDRETVGLYTHSTKRFSDGDLFGKIDKATLSRASMYVRKGDVLTVWKTPRKEVVPSNEYLQTRKNRPGFPRNINLYEPFNQPTKSYKLPIEFKKRNPNVTSEEVRLLDGQHCIGVIQGEAFNSALEAAKKDDGTLAESILKQELLARFCASEEQGREVTRNGMNVEKLATGLAQIRTENKLALASSSSDPCRDLGNIKPSSKYLIRYKRLLLSMFS